MRLYVWPKMGNAIAVSGDGEITLLNLDMGNEVNIYQSTAFNEAVPSLHHLFGMESLDYHRTTNWEISCHHNNRH